MAVLRNRKKTDASSSEKKNSPSLETQGKAAAVNESKFKKVLQRLVFGLLMLGLFVLIIFSGHIYAWLLVVFLQTLIFRELVAVRYIAAAEKEIPRFRTVQWCWFGSAMWYTYGESFREYILNKEGIMIPTVIVNYLQYHSWISFSLYSLLFVLSVLSLKKGFYKYQVGQLTWTLVTIGLIVFQMKHVLNSIFNGLFWFVFPVSLVVCNDCFAYFCGRSFGRRFTQKTFLRISPNKTWEGFIGAFFCTLIYSFYASAVLARYSWMICPVEQIQMMAEPLTCDPAPVFKPALYAVSENLQALTQQHVISLLPIQLHALIFATFTSIIAPFGGFLASAIKRAYNIKDFDSYIPGHGGVMDRMDCQLITSLFTAVYFSTFIATAGFTVPRLMTLISQLSSEDQLSILEQLQKSLGHAL